MKGKKRVEKGLKRVAISSTDKSIDNLDALSENMGMDRSNTISVLLEEFVKNARVRKEFEAYCKVLYKVGQMEVGRSGVFRNYMLPGKLLESEYVQQARVKYGLSDFVRTLIYFNHDTKLLAPAEDIGEAVLEKIEAAGLKVLGFQLFERILNVQIDISHLYGKK